MNSLRTKTMLLTVGAVIITVTVLTIIVAFAIKDLGDSSSNQILRLLCETGQRNLNAYFESVEQSVESVSSYAEADLENTPLDELESHLNRARKVFEKTANNTSGVLTYYYRIDPAASSASKGFWYVNLDGEGFREHEVTDITLYDTDDQSALVWFTVPKATGRSIWLPPYNTENLDKYVLSYNVPLYKDGLFIGVIGIEIDYTTMTDVVDSISLYENGYAFINDAEGNIIYHPHVDARTLAAGEGPEAPRGLLSDSTYIRYYYNDVEKQAVWLPLDNGMRLNVTVPISEISAGWHKLINEIVAVSCVLLLVFVVGGIRFAEQITKPLKELTTAAFQVNGGNFDVKLDYDRNDEVGLLTRTFNQLISHLKHYIGDLSSLAYADALTSVHNKGAYDIYIRDLQAELLAANGDVSFGVGVFDCDNLKRINDEFGHDKGDIYLKTASRLICRVFQHSPVFRTGGDEFAVVLRGEDFENREALLQQFEEKSRESCAAGTAAWEQARVAVGVAVYDSAVDQSAADVTRRADRAMYSDKKRRKTGR